MREAGFDVSFWDCSAKVGTDGHPSPDIRSTDQDLNSAPSEHDAGVPTTATFDNIEPSSSLETYRSDSLPAGSFVRFCCQKCFVIICFKSHTDIRA
jgi:hypothetical protein